MKVTISQIFLTDVPFLIHVISFEVVITPLLTRLFLSHTDAQASSLLIFHTSLWLIFFSFLTWLGFEMTKIRMCWQHPPLSPSFPLSLFLSHSVTLPFLLPCDSQLAHLWWVWWHPPLCLASFSFSIFSPLLFYLSSCAPSFSFTLPLIISTLLFFSPCHSSGCTKQGLGMIEALTWEFFHWGLLSSAVPQRDLSLLGFTSPSGLASQRTPHGNSLSSCLHALSSIASVPVPHTYPLVIWPNRALCLPN